MFRKERLNQEIQTIDFEDLDFEDFEFYEDEARFMTEEIFMVEQDINTIKKLLFIATYYKLTKDKKILNIINKYSKSAEFQAYCEIIFGDDKGYPKKLKK